MTERVEEEAADGPVPPSHRVRILRDVSLGSLMQMVPLVGLLGTAIATFSVGVSAITRIEDGIAHEEATRAIAIHTLETKIEDLARQEARDVTDIKLSIGSVRDDIRGLVTSGRR